MRKRIGRIFIYPVLSLLVMLAPMIVNQQASLFFWGEPEIPESLRNG
ncbi:cyclic lactone autoinducer peptide [Alkalibacter rhizosphaerae]|uniref:Cyclic lactone autoinducer peptide n=1 Tax=Alkalibacter rhizosphaerae TaxID=2815577 RepID=A0A974XKM9_9FIRM|nr:cyclic lactone autoinducer peptide [Alkalibacter rhizosphaerae]